MTERPYTILSCRISLDGYLGGATKERLVLSDQADLDRVDAARADSDAILAVLLRYALSSRFEATS